VKRLLAHLALLVVALIYGGNYLVAKGLMPDLVGPSGFIVLRVTGALVLFGLLILARPEKIDRKDVPRMVFCGLTGVGINMLLFFNGLNSTSPVNASLIMTVNPVLVLIASAVLLGQPIVRRRLVGVILGGLGAAAILVWSSSGERIHASWQGDLMILVNATSYAFYLVAVKPLMSKYRPLTVITWVFLFGWLFTTPIGWSQAMAIDWSAFGPKQWAGVAYVVLATTFLVYLLNIFALQNLQPTVVSVYIYLQPLLATLLSFAQAHNGGTDYMVDVGWPLFVFGGLIFVGVYLVGRPVRTQVAKG
jgi:drug/metabolite transporter (DMT)-like permease